LIDWARVVNEIIRENSSSIPKKNDFFPNHSYLWSNFELSDLFPWEPEGYHIFFSDVGIRLIDGWDLRWCNGLVEIVKGELSANEVVSEKTSIE
jgi:hypothetical protein